MLSKLTYGNKFCTVEHTSIDGQEQIYGLVLSKKQKELVIDTSFEIDAIKKLSNHIPTKQHLFLIINTNKVLFKGIDEPLEHLQAVQQAFPNLKLDDFYYETYTSKDKTFVAICRKEDIHTMLKTYQEMQYSVIGFSLGNLGISVLENVVNHDELLTSNATIRFSNQTISNIIIDSPEKRSFSINGLELTSNTLLSLAGILTYYTNTAKTVSNFNQITSDLKEKYKQRHIFNLGLKISLATIFVLLLFSFLLFTNYSTKIEKLNTTLALNKTQKTSLLKLTNEVQKKEKLIHDFSLASSRASWYLDQIGEALPHSIILSEIQWQPLIKSVKKDKPIETVQQTIRIKGISTKGDDFSSWLSTLERLDWVDDIAINAYGSGKKKSTSFEIEIIFNP